FFVLWDGTLLSVAGLLVAVTPMVLFIASVLNPNGLELGANAAFLASGIRIARAPTESPRWVWASRGVSGAAAVLSWQLGPVVVVAFRQPLLLVVACAIAVGFPVAFAAFLHRPPAVVLQAREVVGMWVIVPIHGCELLQKRAEDRLAVAIADDASKGVLALLH